MLLGTVYKNSNQTHFGRLWSKHMTIKVKVTEIFKFAFQLLNYLIPAVKVPTDFPAQTLWPSFLLRPSSRSNSPTRTPNTPRSWATWWGGSQMRPSWSCHACPTAANPQKDRHQPPRMRWDPGQEEWNWEIMVGFNLLLTVTALAGILPTARRDPRAERTASAQRCQYLGRPDIAAHVFRV